MHFFNNFISWWESNSCNYEAILFDVDGTLISGGKALPGGSDIVEWLRRHDFPFFLLTNDGNHSPQEKCESIKLGGIDIEPDEIISCAHALKSAADEFDLINKTVFVLGSLGNPCFAEAAGIRVTRDTREISDCAAVIVGEGRYDWQKSISAAVNLLKNNPDIPLIVPNPDSYWPNGKPGEIGIGAGGKARFMAGILAEAGIVVEPVYLGKPYPAIYHYTIEVMSRRFGLDEKPHPEKVIMLGDSLASDIRGANNCGMTSGLMLTGITDLEMAEKAENSFCPDLVFNTLV